MLRAMYSAISGLMNHQLRMDVIGNDISNVNTLAYKSKSVEFVETFSQISRYATNSNPVGIAVGLGSTVQGITTNFLQGTFQRTNVSTDLGISGDGFFIVGSRIDSATGLVDNNNGTTSFTRAGDFIIDQDGYLRTQDGQYVLGYEASTVATTTPLTFPDGTAIPAGVTPGFATDSKSTVAATDTALVKPDSADFNQGNLRAIRIPSYIQTDTATPTPTTEKVADFSIGTDGKITIVGDGGQTSCLGYVATAKFDNNTGLTPLANSYYQASDASGPIQYLPAGTGGTGQIQEGVLELSNVDLSSEFADMILTQRGFDANAKIISTADEMLQTLINMKR